MRNKLPEHFEVGDIVESIPMMGQNSSAYMHDYWNTNSRRMYVVTNVDWAMENITATCPDTGKSKLAPMTYWKIIRRTKPLTRLIFDP